MIIASGIRQEKIWLDFTRCGLSNNSYSLLGINDTMETLAGSKARNPKSRISKLTVDVKRACYV